jgi:YggT family protein
MIILGPLLSVLENLISLYKLCLITYIILGLMETFDIVNKYSTTVYTVHNFLQSIIEPALGPIRRVLPSIGGWDLSPMALIFIIHFLQGVVLKVIERFPS